MWLNILDELCFYAAAKGVVAHAKVASVPERRNALPRALSPVGTVRANEDRLRPVSSARNPERRMRPKTEIAAEPKGGKGGQEPKIGGEAQKAQEKIAAAEKEADTKEHEEKAGLTTKQMYTQAVQFNPRYSQAKVANDRVKAKLLTAEIKKKNKHQGGKAF